MSPAPNDGQRRAIEARGADVCVVAGAGTGKTRVLTERIVQRVVDDGVDLRRLLAITFTERAAGEMKDRLARALLERGRTTAREEVESAAISTIHAFCARLLREHAIEAGVDPGFVVLDDVRATRVEREARDALMAELAAEDPARLDALGVLPGADPDETLLHVYRAARASTDDVGAFVRRLPYPGARSALAVALSDATAALAEVRGVGPPKTQQRVDRALAAAELVPGDDADAVDAAAAVHALRKSFDLSCSADVKPFLADVRTAADDLLRALAAEALQPFREQLAATLARLAELHTEAKGHGAALDFTDLELRAVRLLADQSSVRRAARSRWAEVLVDEFQDVNPLQARLLDLLRPENALFVVGDPKQSIYGFRGADVEVFLRHEERAASTAAELVRLQESYRARPELTGVVNALFASGLSDADPDTGLVAVPFEPLVSALDFVAKEVPSVEAVCVQTEDAAAGHRAEARWIAERIVALVDGAEALTLTDRSEDDAVDGRPAGYGDVAVLLRATTQVKLLERELLERDVPYLVVKGRGFYDAREVVDVANLLACVDDSGDDVALAAVLRSPLCGIDDDALFCLTSGRAGKRGDREPLAAVLARWTAGEDGAPQLADRDARRLRRFVGIFADLRARRGSEPLAALIDRALGATDLDTIVLARRNGRQRAANLRKVREMAVAADAAGDRTLGEFAAELRRLRQLEVRETEAPVAGASRGAVSILTVHAAKGLEFPIVVVPGLGRETGREIGAIASDPARGLAVRTAPAFPAFDGVVPHDFQRLRAREQARSVAEEMRLLYVALTRAEEHLVLVAAVSRRSERPWWDRVAALLDAAVIDPAVIDPAVIDPAAIDPAKPGDIDVGPGADAAQRTRALVRLLEPVEPTLASGPRSRPRLATVAPALRARRVPAGDVPAASSESAVARVAESRRPLPPATGTLYATTVSALVTFARCPEEFHCRHVLGLPESLDLRLGALGDPDPSGGGGERPGDDDEWGLPLDARARGRAAHLALERLVPDFSGDIETVVRASLRTETGGAPPDPRDVQRIVGWVRGFAASEIGAAVRGVPRESVRREQAVLLRAGRTIVRGQIDLVFRSDDGWIVVDHKAGRLAEATPEYTLQMQLYALALRGVTGEIPVRSVLFSLPEARAVDISTTAEELADLEAGLLAELGRRTRDRDYAPTGETPCGTCAYRAGCAFVR